jgi:squalene-hopene/tetraprenyl-beta-curcumene cyclase
MRKLAGRILIVTACMTSVSTAAEPIAENSVDSPADIAPNEPYAKEFSLERIARYLDSAALDWQRTHACTSCHTMVPYLMARPTLSSISPQSAELRQFFEDIVAGKREAMPDYSCNDVEGAVAVGVASAMALNDRWATGKLHPLTRQALDRMWTLQRSDGGWTWPFRDTPPLKIDEQYGVTLAAIGAGMAPDDYANSPAARAGMERVRHFLRKTPPVSLHQKAMLLWASIYVGDLLSAEAKDRILANLLNVQRPDGGWSMAHLVDNTQDPALPTDRVARATTEEGYNSHFLSYLGRDAIYKSSLASDGYATGLVIFVARQAGVPASDSRLQRGLKWLKSNQRASGRWFTPSQGWHTQHLISNAGTAYAALALFACGEIPSPN